MTVRSEGFGSPPSQTGTPASEDTSLNLVKKFELTPLEQQYRKNIASRGRLIWLYRHKVRAWGYYWEWTQCTGPDRVHARSLFRQFSDEPMFVERGWGFGK